LVRFGKAKKAWPQFSRMGDEAETEAELRERCRLERVAIVEKYDLGRDDGAKIDDWEDPKLEIYHIQDKYGFLQ
jgi:hypothetical protein